MTIIANTQQLLDIENLLGTSANCTVGIYTFIVKSFFYHLFLLFSHNVQRSIQTQVSPYNTGKKSIYMS